MAEELKPTRAMILVPYYGGMDQQHIAGINQLIAQGWLHATVNNCGLIDHARAALAGMALRDTHGFDMVLWVDSDVLFTPYQAHAIVNTARELDAMVSAPIIIKQPRGPIMCAGIEKGTVLRFGPERGAPVPCLGIPFGFTAMPMHWLKIVCDAIGPSPGPGGIEVWPAFSCKRSNVSGVYMSEDYSFCERLRDLGGKCYLDTRRRVGHKGSYVYTIEDGFWQVPALDEFEVHVGDTPVFPEEPLAFYDAAGTTREAPPAPVENPIETTCGPAGPLDRPIFLAGNAPISRCDYRLGFGANEKRCLREPGHPGGHVMDP